jgi:hypothetical protein
VNRAALSDASNKAVPMTLAPSCERGSPALTRGRRMTRRCRRVRFRLFGRGEARSYSRSPAAKAVVPEPVDPTTAALILT